MTGSAGHLGEAWVRTLQESNHEVIGIDLIHSHCPHQLGSLVDRAQVKRCLNGVDAVLYTATLHKPHLATHRWQDFVDTTITGTLNLLEEAAAVAVSAFIFTRTTSAFGRALTPPAGAPAAWVTEDTVPIPNNIYGVTKTAAAALGEVVRRQHRLPCLILRTARFFPEEDDDHQTRQTYQDGNVKANEFLYRRVELADGVSAHRLALDQAPALGFGRYIISATTPFTPDDLVDLRVNAPPVVTRYFPDYDDEYARRGWNMFPSIGRV